MDNIQVRKFVSQNHVAAAVDLLVDPMIELYYPNRQSIISYHQHWYQCTMHRRCDLGIDAPMSDCVNPIPQYYHPNSMKSILLNQAIWLKRNKLAHLMLIRLWCAALVYSNPILIDLMLHRRQSMFVHRAVISPIECNCHVVSNPIGWLDFYCSAAKYQQIVSSLAK